MFRFLTTQLEWSGSSQRSSMFRFLTTQLACSGSSLRSKSVQVPHYAVRVFRFLTTQFACSGSSLRSSHVQVPHYVVFSVVKWKLKNASSCSILVDRYKCFGVICFPSVQGRIFYGWFQTLVVLSMLHFIFWVIPRRLNYICRRFGTICSIFLGRVNKNYEDGTECFEMWAHKFRSWGTTQKTEYILHLFLIVWPVDAGSKFFRNAGAYQPTTTWCHIWL